MLTCLIKFAFINTGIHTNYKKKVSDMDIKIIMKEYLDYMECTKHQVLYGSDLVRVSDNLDKYEQLKNITISDLEYTNLSEVRLIGKCYNILNVHTFTKHALIEMIRIKFNELTVFDDNKNTPNDDNIHIQLPQRIQSMHETKIQSSLEIGEPVPYDSDEYFDIYIITEMYHQYPVQYIYDKKNDREIMSFKTMLDFMKHCHDKFI